jgi:hypothetical protein
LDTLLTPPSINVWKENTRHVPHYLVKKRLLLSLTSSAILLGCGDGGTDPDPVATPDFQIELVFVNHGTPSQDAAFIAAANRWMDILGNELPEVDFSSNPIAADACVQGQPAVDDTIDDLRIFVDISPIDGPLATLGQAGPCQIRTISRLPVLGFLQLDAADVARLEADGDLDDVALHEMGHVLGIGTLWNDFDTLLVNQSEPSNPGADTHFAGAAAIAAFDAAGGTTYNGAKVPVENQLGPGSSDTHWRESVLRLELMTPELAEGVNNSLSAVTIQSLADLGYSVDPSKADTITWTFAGPPPLAVRRGGVVDLGNDAYRGPIGVVDQTGAVVWTIPGR